MLEYIARLSDKQEKRDTMLIKDYRSMMLGTVIDEMIEIQT